MKTVLIGCFFLAGFGTALAQNSWTEKTPGPGNYWHAVVSANGYLITWGSETPATWRYDPVADAWTQLADCPTVISGGAYEAVNGTCYSFGNASDKTGTIYAFDVAAGSWSTLTVALIPARYCGSAAVANGRIFVCGGFTESGDSPAVEEFDPVTRTLTPRAPLPEASSYATAGGIRNKVYYAGGFSNAGVGSLDTCYEFDPALNQWNTRANMPARRNASASFVVASRLYVVGGWYLGYANSTFEFSPKTNAWAVRANLPDGRDWMGGCTISGKGYVYGGDSNSIGGYYACTEYTPPVFGVPPATPVGLTMSKPDGTPIAEGGFVTSSGVILGATVTDPDPNQDVTIEIEAVPAASAFTGRPIVTAGWGSEGPVSALFVPTSDGVWKWACRSVDEDDNRSAWVTFGSPAPDFVADAVPPGVPAPIRPINEDVGIFTRDGGGVTFEWSPAFDGTTPATGYELQVSTSAAFPGAWTDSTAATAASVILIPSSSQRFWRVRSLDAAGNASAWSASVPFRAVFVDTVDHGAGDAPCAAGVQPGNWLPVVLLFAISASWVGHRRGSV